MLKMLDMVREEGMARGESWETKAKNVSRTQFLDLRTWLSRLGSSALTGLDNEKQASILDTANKQYYYLTQISETKLFSPVRTAIYSNYFPAIHKHVLW